MTQTNYTAQQKAQMFAMSTRQNRQMLAKETAKTLPTTLQFLLPKARLLSSLMVSVKVTFPEDVSATMELEKLPKLLRRISLDLNNGFQPFVVSGEECRMYNLVDLNADNTKSSWFAKDDEEGKVYTMNFFLPCTTNPRDPVGLILLQNDQTNVTMSIDLGLISDCGISTEPTKVEVKAMAETFSVPANETAYPDITVLKLVHGRKDSLPSEGQQTIKLTTGTIYRKLIMRLTDENGAPMDVSDITSDIQIIFNQADINYSIDPEMLRILNEKELGTELPEGMFVFDWSNSGGLPNLGGTRDMIDSANLTEFWVKFTTTKKGKCEIVTETLSRLVKA